MKKTLGASRSRSVVLVGMVGLAAACQQPQPASASANVVATYRSAVLTRAELQAAVEAAPGTDNPTDSAAFAERYVQDWLARQAMARAALDSLPGVDDSLAPLLRQYRDQLLRLALLAHAARQVDTTTTEADLLAFYQQHSTDYLATAAQYQYLLLVLPAAQLPVGQADSLLAMSPQLQARWRAKCAAAGTPCQLDSAWTDAAQLSRMGLPDWLLRQAAVETPRKRVLQVVVPGANGDIAYAFVLLDRVEAGQPLPLPLVAGTVRAAVRSERCSRYLEQYEARILQQTLTQTHEPIPVHE